MRIFIVGAGAVGSLMAKVLSKEKWVSGVVCADRDLRRGRRFLGRAKKVRLVEADASDVAGIARAAAGADVIVNAGLPDFNEKVMQAALKVGAHYQDLCSYLEDLRNAEQMRYRARFRKAGRTALINTGVAPGLTNLMAAELADGFDRVDTIKIRLLEDQDATEPVFTWSPAVMLDELTARPLVRRNRRFTLSQPFTEPEQYEFPVLGARRVVSIYGDEVATIPLFIKARNVDMKSGGTDIDFGAALYGSGMLREKPVYFRGKKVVPLRFFEKLAAQEVPTPAEMVGLIEDGVIRNANFAAAVEATGTVGARRRTRCLAAVYPDLKTILRRSPGATYISYPTAITAAAFTRLFAAPLEKGVLPPEALTADRRASVITDLRQEGIVLVERRPRGEGWKRARAAANA